MSVMCDEKKEAISKCDENSFHDDGKVSHEHDSNPSGRDLSSASEKEKKHLKCVLRLTASIMLFLPFYQEEASAL